MTRDELIEKVAADVFRSEFKNNDSYEVAEDILNTIYEALKEPTEQMISDGDDIINYMILKSESIYKAMLNASPLAKEV